MSRIQSHRDLRVYQTAFEAARLVLRATRRFPSSEKYDLTSQIRSSARSVCANIAEAWRKRRYPASLVAKLVDAEAEAAETQVWLEFALEDGYILDEEFRALFDQYEKTISQLVLLGNKPDRWSI